MNEDENPKLPERGYFAPETGTAALGHTLCGWCHRPRSEHVGWHLKCPRRGMMQVEYKKIRVPVTAHTRDGVICEWREVDGVEITPPPVELKNGDTLTLTYSTHNTGQDHGSQADA